MCPRGKDVQGCDCHNLEQVLEEAGAANDPQVVAVIMDSESFIALHQNQLRSSGVPEHLWETLRRKLVNSVFDAADYFSLLKVEDEDGNFIKWKAVVQRENGISAEDPESLFLVDHAWTFRPEIARKQLEQVPGLLQRMTALMDIVEEEVETRVDLIEKVLVEMWRFVSTYSVGNPEAEVEDRMPIWYVLDEFGARIQHSNDNANVRIVPFFSLIDGAAYGLLFPIKDIACDEEVVRDCLEGPEASDELVRTAMQNIWEDVDMTDVDHIQKEPPSSFFQMSREDETLPPEDFQPKPLPDDRKIKVYAEYKYIGENLTDEKFEMVDTMNEADIIWLTSHFKDFKGFSESFPEKRINQFPYENVITIKDLLCVVCRRDREEKDDVDHDLKDNPDWLPTTYNLKTELPQFVSFFQKRAQRDLDNHWIVKPWNLARGLDTHVTPHLHQILKLQFSGPKIAQKYLHDPVLFNRPEIGKVKFDIRYILLLRNTEPLVAFAYNRFWLRFANEPFSLDNFDQYEKHFTVMNYNEQVDLKQMFCHDFIEEFESQYPDFKWSDIEKRILSMFKSMFEMAVAEKPPSGIARSPQSRAMYACDLMLQWEEDKVSGSKTMVPKLLEINWGPDCKRACEYYPEFFNNVFNVLYLDKCEGQNVTQL